MHRIRERPFGRWILRGAGAVGLLFVGLAGWLLLEVYAVQSNLAAAQTGADRLRIEMLGHHESSDKDLGFIRKHVAAARRAAATPVWEAAENVPLMGPPLRTARGLSLAADEMATGVLPEAVRLRQMLESGQILHNDGVDLHRLSSVSFTLGNVQRQLSRVQAGLRSLPSSTGISRVDMARQRMSDRVTRISDSVSKAKVATRLMLPVLGASGPRSYFLAFQTNAEARGTGGLVGSFGIVTTDHGRITLHDFSSDDALPSAATPVANFGPEFDSRYGAAKSTQLLANSNLSAHFPYAAKIWADLWQRRTGQRLDGAIATDPVGLSHVLQATGPVRLPNGELLTAANTVELTESTFYTRYSIADTMERKGFLVQVAQSVSAALLHGQHDSAALLEALWQNADEGRLRVWSRDASTETALEEDGVAGEVPENAGPFAYLVVNNAAGNKLDYYLGRSLTYQLGPCEDGTRSSEVRIRLTNAAPTAGLPAYVTLRADDPAHPHLPGSTRVWLSLYASMGAQFTGGTLDGQPLLMAPAEERGHLLLGAGLELQPGQTRDVDIHLLEPASNRPPVVPVQPLVRPQINKVLAQPCSKDSAPIR